MFVLCTGFRGSIRPIRTISAKSYKEAAGKISGKIDEKLDTNDGYFVIIPEDKAKDFRLTPKDYFVIYRVSGL